MSTSDSFLTPALEILSSEPFKSRACLSLSIHSKRVKSRVTNDKTSFIKKYGRELEGDFVKTQMSIFQAQMNYHTTTTTASVENIASTSNNAATTTNNTTATSTTTNTKSKKKKNKKK